MSKKISTLMKTGVFAISLIAVLNAPAKSQELRKDKSSLSEENMLKGPDKILDHLSDLYGEEYISSTRHLRVRDAISNFPSENLSSTQKVQAVNNWIFIGPYGAPVAIGTLFSGRVRDIEMRDTINDHLRVLSASGGLWEYSNVNGVAIPVSLSSNVNSEWGGSFVTDPADENTIFLGTGEPQVHGGTGLWKTTDRGATWTSVPMSPAVSSFYQIKYDPQNSSIMHAACGEGYYRSDDGGATWVRHLSGGNCSDVIVDFQNNQNVFVAMWGLGIYKSTDGGNAFTKLTSLPVSNVGRTVMAMSKQNGSKFYVNMTNNNNNGTNGVYKTTDGGVTFTTCNLLDLGAPITNFHSNQGWYDNTISVSPVNDDIAIVGGVSTLRTSNGLDFNTIDGKHADMHAMAWNDNGVNFFLGNDGGVFFSLNSGYSFNTLQNSRYNSIPVGQFYHFSVGKFDPSTVAGTLQDDGFQYKSTASNYLWKSPGGGDGAGVQVDPYNNQVIMFGNGIYGSGSPLLASRRAVTQDGGDTWADVNSGILACNDWNPEIRTNAANSTYYTGCGRWLYYSYNLGGSWTKLNPSNMFAADVIDFTVSVDNTGAPNIYVVFNNHSLKVYDRVTQTWVDRIAGIPANLVIKKVAVDIINDDNAYALIRGAAANTIGNKIFKTTDRGQTWVNVTGNLPNVACTDLIANPFNPDYLYLGTEIGAFKSTDGGVTWVRWNFGMPESAEITEMDYADSTAINGTFYVMCSTYGRGIWMRDVSGDDPTGINNISANNSMQLFQNSDNPGNGITLINYNLTADKNIDLRVYDMLGNTVAVLVSEKQQRGSHTITFDRSKLRGGVYTYKLSSENQSLSRKMVIVK